MNRFFLFAIVFILLNGVASAAEPVLKTYKVVGRTAAELMASIKANGPDGSTGRTAYRWGYSYGYFSKNGIFSITKLTIKTTVTITMPRWSGYNSASRCLQKSWDAMYKSLKNHEDRHVALGADVEARLRLAVLATPSSVSQDRLISEIRKKADRIIRKNRAKQGEFDRDTQHGKKDPVDPIILKSCGN